VQAEKDILDFIVIGAQKSGTTSLYHYLRHHPEISLPAGKEAPFFSHDAAYARGWAGYIGNLANNGYQDRGDPARRWGTVTPHYMVGGVYAPARGRDEREPYDERTVPSRIRESLPEVCLIAILRDPVERAISHHRMAAMIGRERRSFDEAMGELLEDDALEDARREPRESTGYVAWGEYGRILAGYFELFAREQILVVFTDELEHAPARLLGRVHEFIGVSPDFTPDNLGARYRVGTVERGFSWSSPSSWMAPSSPLSPQGVQRTLRRSAAVRSLWHVLPLGSQQRLRRPYRRVTRRVVVRNRRKSPNEVRANAKPSPATLERLREHFRQDAGQLGQLLGEAPPWQEV
jgi:hypothetical protein